MIRASEAEACAKEGQALAMRGEFAEAIPFYQRAIEIGAHSKDLAEYWGGLAVTLALDGQVAAALRAFESALSINRDFHRARVQRALLLLKSGDLRNGWAEYEWRRKLPEWKGLRLPGVPQWQGEGDARGRTIILLGEQGLGDTIQFVRYAALVARRGFRVVVGCRPELKRLIASMDTVQRVYDRNDRDISADLQCDLMSLPLHCGTTLETIPNRIPYLRADLTAVDEWSRRLGPRTGFRVGLVWAGGSRPEPMHEDIDRRRSFDLSTYGPLFEVPGVQFYSLQKDSVATHPRLTPYPTSIQDFLDTAPLIANLDLVISVDTSVAHLAGAMGKPVWLLSRYDGCWRWLFDRSDTPWYPTMRIFRQPRSGDWSSVITEVRKSLQVLPGLRTGR